MPPAAPRFFRALPLLGLSWTGIASAAEGSPVPIAPPTALSPIEAARSLAYQSQAAYDAGDYATAAATAEAAQRLVPAPTLALLEARSLHKLGRWLAARTQYRIAAAPVASSAPVAFQRAQRAALVELELLELELPRLAVQPRAGGDDQPTQVTVDGLVWPRASWGVWVPLDPGEHLVHVKWKAGSEQHKVDLKPRAEEQVLLGAPANAGLEELRIPLALGAFGLGALGLGSGIAFGVHAANRRGELSPSCEAGVCSPTEQAALDESGTYRDLSTVGYVVGAVGAVAGTGILIAFPNGSGRSDGSLAVLASPTQLMLRGKF